MTVKLHSISNDWAKNFGGLRFIENEMYLEMITDAFILHLLQYEQWIFWQIQIRKRKNNRFFFSIT